MAFTNLKVDNFTITDSFVFTNTNSPSDQDSYAFCQVRITKHNKKTNKQKKYKNNQILLEMRYITIIEAGRSKDILKAQDLSISGLNNDKDTIKQ